MFSSLDIKIRAAEPLDYRELQRLFQGEKAVWGTLQHPYTSQELWRKRLEDLPDNAHSLIAYLQDEVAGDDVLGNLGLFPSKNPRRAHSAYLGMVVREDAQGKGVGTALMKAVIDLADNWLNLLRLELNVFVDNEPAVKLYQKFDFQIEGTHPLYAFRNGEYVDCYTMARLHPRMRKTASAENAGQ